MAPSLLAALEAAVEDVVAATSAAGLGNGADGVGWVDLSPLLPSVLSEADVAVLLARMPFLQDQDLIKGAFSIALIKRAFELQDQLLQDTFDTFIRNRELIRRLSRTGRRSTTFPVRELSRHS